MEKERLSLLKAAIKTQGAEIEQIFGKIEDRQRKEGEANRESLAYQLHNLYGAFEDLFKIVADFFENHIDDSAHYHTALLWRMNMPIEGIMPHYPLKQATNC